MTTNGASTATRAALILAVGPLPSLSAQAADPLAKARWHLDTGQRSARRRAGPAAALRRDVSLGAQRIDDAETAHTQALAFDPGKERVGPGGIVLALTGDADEARSLVAELER